MSIEIDARGLLCPLPVLRLRKVLLAQPEGGVVRLLATDPVAVIDVPHFCSEGGHRLLGSRTLEGGATEYTVARGPETAERPSSVSSPIRSDTGKEPTA